MGLGGRGRHWVRDAITSEDVEFVGMVDPDAERMALAAKDSGVPAEQQFAALDEACDKARPEAAVIVTPNVLHDQHIDMCLDRGLHVLAEKPFVMDRCNGRAIVAKAEAKGLVAMAVQNYRYNGGPTQMRRLVAGKQVGEPTSAVIHFSRLRPIQGMPYAMLYNQGIHILDAIRFVFDCNARTVYARSWRPKYHECDADTSCEAIFELENGVVVNFSGNYSTHGPNTSYGGVWRIECAKGTIHFNPGGEGEQVCVSRAKGDLEEVPSPPTGGSANLPLLRDLARAVEDGVTPPTHARDNLHSLAMIWGIIESSKTNRVVAVDGTV